MSIVDTAKSFFDACETGKGWTECAQYCAPDATFSCQSQALADTHTLEAYSEWMKGFGTITAPGATYDLHTSSYDEGTRSAVFFATYHAKHTGDGGPVPPTNRETHSHYVYVLTMDDNDQVGHMVKIWNAPWAMREIGWIE